MKTIIAKLLNNWLGNNIKNDYNELNVAIYKDTNHIGQHGIMLASHAGKKVRAMPVPFVFPGMTEPPKLDARLMVDLFSAFESQGWIPHHIVQYGSLSDVVGQAVQTTGLAVPANMMGDYMLARSLQTRTMDTPPVTEDGLLRPGYYPEGVLNAEKAWARGLNPGVGAMLEEDTVVPVAGPSLGHDYDVPAFLRKGGVNPVDAEQATRPTQSAVASMQKVAAESIFDQFVNHLPAKVKEEVDALESDVRTQLMTSILVNISNSLARGGLPSDAMFVARTTMIRCFQQKGKDLTESFTSDGAQ